MDGLELVKKARTLNPSVPILMITTNDAKEDHHQGLKAGVNDLIVKPFTLEVLKEKIHKILKG